jgi:DNA-binding transcriptional LysR family regulator
MVGFDAFTLECFLAIAEKGSFTQAADKVGRTQSAISQQIAKLELQLGKPVFIRGKKFTLTPEGEAFASYARQIVKLNHEALDLFRNPDLQGEVSFGLPEDFASTFLFSVLKDYIDIHPRILLNVECDLTLNLFERFKRKEFDLVLVKMSKPIEYANCIEVYSESLEWVGKKNTLWKEQNQTLPLVLSPHPCVYRTMAINSLKQYNKKWRITFSSHSYAGKIAAVKAGMGITVMPRNMIPEELEAISGEHDLPNLDGIHISLLKHDSVNPAVNSIEKFISDKLK